MKDLRDLSGPWTGFWIQGKRRGTMRLRMRFLGEVVDGDGNDLVGSFAIRGTYDPATEAVAFVKTYPNSQVYYSGKWDGAMIHGRWTFGRRLRWVADEGEFEIWPETEEETTTEAREEADRREPVGV